MAQIRLGVEQGQTLQWRRKALKQWTKLILRRKMINISSPAWHKDLGKLFRLEDYE
ncbi:MAG: hypothetical protein OEV92_04005 [Nitrospinota bacterium]|nr:hypothetical protein [Nitrospinota bacterium]